MKLFALLGLLFLLIVPAYAQDDGSSDAPYLYYYSNVLKGIVIERADGTDSRVLGRGMVDENVQWTWGPGWSADGTWFAWHTEPDSGIPLVGAKAKGYAVSIDGQTLPILSEFPCVYQMYWHPTDNILLVYGNAAQDIRDGACVGNSGPIIETYWLIDADRQTLLATFSFGPITDSRFSPVIHWDESNELTRFPVVYRSFAGGEYVPYRYLVTMHFNGEVQMEPTSRENASSALDGLMPTLPTTLPNRERPFEVERWLDYPEERIDNAPPAIDYAGPAVAGQWDEKHEWILIGHEYCTAGCGLVVGPVSIFNPATGSSREISDCGGHPSCIGWLPEHINVDVIPPGRPESVLPEPTSIDYKNEPKPTYPMIYEQTHELVCNAETGRLELVINIDTGAIDYSLPEAERCGTPIQREPEVIYDVEPVVFAVSPDEAYYAITDESMYTSLYDAGTGERITTLNFYGVQLSFSDDSQYLITASASVTATWDIQELIANHTD